MQLWLSYQELGEFFDLPTERARDSVIEAGWMRHKGRDGVTRVQLPPTTAHTYLLQFALSAEVQDHVSALRDVYQQVRDRTFAKVA